MDVGKCHIHGHLVILFVGADFIEADCRAFKEISCRCSHCTVHYEDNLVTALEGVSHTDLMLEPINVLICALDIRVITVTHSIAIILQTAFIHPKCLQIPAVLSLRGLQTFIAWFARRITTLSLSLSLSKVPLCMIVLGYYFL